MEYLPNGITIELSPGTFPLSTDSVVLGHFAHLPKNARVLDLGSGCGTLGLLLCSKDPGCRVTGLEITENAHAAAVDNIRRNGLEARMESICTDLRSVSQRFAPGCFSCCISNPPYFSGGPANQATPLARRDDVCSTEELFSSVEWALKYGGDFFLVHKPERLAELITTGSRHGMELKRLCLLRHREGSPICLILLSFRKGGKPGLKLEEEALFHADDTPTAYFRQVYHLE